MRIIVLMYDNAINILKNLNNEQDIFHKSGKKYQKLKLAVF